MMKFIPLQASTESTLRVITNHVNSVNNQEHDSIVSFDGPILFSHSPANILSDSTKPDESHNCKISLYLTAAFCSGTMPDCIYSPFSCYFSCNLSTNDSHLFDLYCQRTSMMCWCTENTCFNFGCK